MQKYIQLLNAPENPGPNFPKPFCTTSLPTDKNVLTNVLTNELTVVHSSNRGRTSFSIRLGFQKIPVMGAIPHQPRA